MERAVRTNLLGAILPIAMLFSSSAATSEQTSDVASVIADAMSAAPPYISQNATIVGRNMRVLRKGSAKWTCIPSQPAGVPSPNPMCADGVTLQFFSDLRAGKKSNITQIGVSYMLRGDLTKARSKFLKAYEREPTNPTILNNLRLLNSSSRFIQRAPAQ